MQKVFEDKACAEFLLQIILNRTDLKVLRVNGQQDIKNLQGRSVRLDILAVDANSRVYNIEIQRSDKGAGENERGITAVLSMQMSQNRVKNMKICVNPMLYLLRKMI